MADRRMVLTGIACAASAPLMGNAGVAPTKDQSILSDAVAHRLIPGAVSLIRRDKRLGVQVVGLRDVETRAPMTRDTIFRIASMTKPITAVCVLTLVDDAKLE